MEKRDNNTIFSMGIPIMVSLFQANYVTGRTALEWKNLIDFYFLYNDYSKDLDTITNKLLATYMAKQREVQKNNENPSWGRRSIYRALDIDKDISKNSAKMNVLK